MLTAYKTKQQNRPYVVDSSKVTVTPAGWHKPYGYYTFDNLSKMRFHPPQKRGALAHVPSEVIALADLRIIPPDIERQLAGIDSQILELRKRYSAIVADNFLTFPLATIEDLPVSHTIVYQTKSEALAARGNK